MAIMAFARTAVRWLVAAALFLMMAITVLDVIGRYLINRPFPGSAELIQYMMVAFIFLALPVVTLRNEHISSFRRHKRPQVSTDSVPEEFFAREGDQETKVLTTEVMARISELSPGQREVLLLNCASGLSYEEIAEAIGCSVRTVKSRLWRARNEMHKRMLGPDEEPQQIPRDVREYDDEEAGVSASL